jgi:hypothetical protein
MKYTIHLEAEHDGLLEILNATFANSHCRLIGMWPVKEEGNEEEGEFRGPLAPGDNSDRPEDLILKLVQSSPNKAVTLEEIKTELRMYGLSGSSASVTLTRLVKEKKILRPSQGLYMIPRV